MTFKAWIVIFLAAAVPARGDETDASDLLAKVADQYSSLATYADHGTVASDVETPHGTIHIVTTFSIKLKRPNLYLISWTQQSGSTASFMTQRDAVWSDGAQPYLYMGAVNAYAKQKDDETALGGAMGISGGAATTIPHLFFPQLKRSVLSHLINPQIERSEPVGDEDCYVVSACSKSSKQETFWISKSRYLILRERRSLEIGAGGGGSQEALKNMKLGPQTETHSDISTPALTAADFQFTPPAGTVLKQSLWP